MLRRQSIIVNRRGDVYDIQAGPQMTIDGGADQIYVIRIQYTGAPPRIRRAPLDHEGFGTWIEQLKSDGLLVSKEDITAMVKSQESCE
jgi:hypothetical protein